MVLKLLLHILFFAAGGQLLLLSANTYRLSLLYALIRDYHSFIFIQNSKKKKKKSLV